MGVGIEHLHPEKSSLVARNVLAALVAPFGNHPLYRENALEKTRLASACLPLASSN
jgi:hypothetical protein